LKLRYCSPDLVAPNLIWLALHNDQARWINPPILWQAAKAQLAI
jgi:hypothetical protein